MASNCSFAPNGPVRGDRAVIADPDGGYLSEVVRLVRSVSRSSGMRLKSDRDTEWHSEQTATELAVMAADIEQLADRTGFLKFASQPGCMRVAFPVYEAEKIAAPFVPPELRSS